MLSLILSIYPVNKQQQLDTWIKTCFVRGEISIQQMEFPLVHMEGKIVVHYIYQVASVVFAIHLR